MNPLENVARSRLAFPGGVKLGNLVRKCRMRSFSIPQEEQYWEISLENVIIMKSSSHPRTAKTGKTRSKMSHEVVYRTLEGPKLGKPRPKMSHEVVWRALVGLNWENSLENVT
jgi:hypothetical protein